MGKKPENDERNKGFAEKSQRRVLLTMTGFDSRQEADWARFIAEDDRKAATATASSAATATATASSAATATASVSSAATATATASAASTSTSTTASTEN